MRRALAHAGLLLLAALPAAAQPSVRVEVAPGEHTVGDRVAVDLVVTTAAGDPAPRFPSWGDSWGEAEIVAVGGVETADAAGGALTHTQRLTVAAFRTGRVPLPPQPVVLPAADGPSRRLDTPADAALDVASVLPPAAEGAERPAPKPARPPRVPPLGAPFWWTAGLLGLLAAVAFGLVLWRFRRRPGEAAAPALPPLGELEAALAEARAAGDPADGLRRVSLALRRYLGRRLGFGAVESTSSEIRRRLAGRRLPSGVARPTADLLLACDLVKFARRPAGAEEVERWAATAAEVAGRVEEHLRPVALAPEAAARREAA